MNTLSYPTASDLSLNSLDLLELNGYRSRFSEKIIQFKRNYDFVGPFIVVFLYGMIALPVFSFSYWLGAFLFAAILVGIFYHKHLVSKSGIINIDSSERRIEIRNRYGKTSFAFDSVDSVFVKSTYNGSYTSADKRTSEEYDIVIGVLLHNGKKMNLFFYKSDFREPTTEIMEVHDYLKAVLRG